MIRPLIGFLVAFLICFSVFAEDGKSSPSRVSKNKCDLALSKKDTSPVKYDSHEYDLIPSAKGKDDDLLVEYEKFVKKMSEDGGVLDQLGIPRTKQVVEFVSGVDMRALTATPAAQPVTHFYDGASVMNAIGDATGIVFEVVFPGAKYQHGYYRDDNPLHWQLSILAHVIGHNHFAVSSHFPHYRASQATEAAVELDDALKEAYRVAPKEDVENYYLMLQTLSNMMDYYSAHYQDPADFMIDKDPVDMPGFGDNQKLQKQKQQRERGLKADTENVLAAFSARIQQSDAAPWQKKLASIIPYTGVYRPALVHTQVMNEGWASIMQEIVLDHMGPEYNSIHHWFEAQHVTRSEAGLNIQDPYWLGVRAWRRLKEKFEQRPEIMALPTAIEKDAAFIEYADKEIISQMDDFQFLNLALDDFMIQGMGIAIYRDATREEAMKLPPPPPDVQNPQPKIIVSKDPARVRKLIIHNSVSRKMVYQPRVKLRSFNRAGSGEVDLVIDDNFGKNVPLNNQTVGPALYALANVVGQPVSLEATFKEQLIQEQHWDWDVDAWHFGFPIWTPPPIIVDRLVRGRLTVTSAGRVTFEPMNFEMVEGNLQNSVQQIVEKHLSDYLNQLHMEDPAKLEEVYSENPRLERLALHSLNQTINGMPVTSLIEHVPSAADAINEYHSKVAGRIAHAFQMAMNGKGGLVNTNRGLFLQALPGPVSINFDGQYLNQLIDNTAPEPIDQNLLIANQKGLVDGDAAKGDLIGPTDLGPGSGGWMPGPSPGGPGKPGKPGDPGEPGEDPGGPLPGDVGLDPTWIPIPDSLYAEFLGEKVKLPNLQSKAGKVRSKKMRMRARQNRRDGQMIIDQTAANALRKGLGANEALGKDSLETDLLETLELGFGLMRPRDFVVKKAKAVNKPDSQVVVTFIRDGSGSTLPYTELYKKFVYDTKTLIKANYDKAVFRYVVFDTKAYEAKSEAEFFQMELGGGTVYGVGIDKAREIHNTEHPASEWDRFAFVVGDLGEYFSERTQASYEALIEESSYSGTVKAGWGVQEFTDNMYRMAEENEFYGFVDLGDNPEGYTVEHIRKLLKNKDED